MLAAPGICVRGLTIAIAVACAALGVAASPPARAATPPSSVTGGRVTLLQPSAVYPRARRCLTRLREELEAGGFDVTISEFGMGGEALWAVDPPSPTDGALATITLLGNPDEGAAELWIVNGVPAGRAIVRRLLMPAGAGAHDEEVLAVRALEFLRASALELARGRSSSASTPSPLSSTAPPPAAAAATTTATTNAAASPSGLAAAEEGAAGSPPERRSVALDLGIALIESSRALGPAFLPVARLRAEWLSLLETRFTLSGFGTQPRIRNQKGTATVGHGLALIELRASFRHGHALRPAIGVGVGVLRLTVDGAGNFPFEGASGQRWAGLFDVGAGLTARLGGRISVAFELHGQLAAPYPTVLFSGEEAVRIGRPALFSSVTLVTPL